MPLLSIHTSTTVSDRAGLLRDASSRVADLLGKPESYVMVELHDGCDLVFAGSDAPAAWLQLKSLGLQESQTAALSAALCDWAAGALRVPAERIYIEFSAPPRAFWGWNRSTF